jgi:hypothetical protein
MRPAVPQLYVVASANDDGASYSISFRGGQAPKIIQNRAFGSLIAMTVRGEICKRCSHRLQLLNLAVQLGHVLQRQAFTSLLARRSFCQRLKSVPISSMEKPSPRARRMKRSL